MVLPRTSGGESAAIASRDLFFDSTSLRECRWAQNPAPSVDSLGAKYGVCIEVVAEHLPARRRVLLALQIEGWSESQ